MSRLPFFYFSFPQWGKSPGLQVLLKLNSLSYILWSSTAEQYSSSMGSEKKLCRSQWSSGLNSPTWFQSHGLRPTWIIPFFFFLCSFPFPATKSHASLEQRDMREKWYHQHPSVVREIKSRCKSAVTAPPIYTGPRALPHAEVSSSLWVFETCCFAASCWGCCVSLEHFC